MSQPQQPGKDLVRYRALTSAYQGRQVAIRTKVNTQVVTAWNASGSWRDADMAQFTRRVIPIVETGQRQTANLVTAYLAQLGRLVFDAAVTRVLAPDVSTVALRGVPATDVWERPYKTFWYEMSEGKTVADAARLGQQRAVSISSTGLQLAKTRTSLDWLLGNNGAIGYRRVLTGLEDCALCVVAATQRYHKQDLMPIHPGCDCGVTPIYRTSDPGQVINRELLDSTYTAVSDFEARTGETFDVGRDYTHLLVTHTHGEYGPTLAWRDQHFTGPAAVNRSSETDD